MSLFQLTSWTTYTGCGSTTTWIKVVLLSASPFVLLYSIHRLLRVPNRVERRIRRFSHIIASHPVISHRGGYPENTLTGIRLAKEKGYKAIEVDLEFTKDGRPVILHDPSVNRTSNGTGNIRELTFEQVRQLDFGIKYGSRYAGERIPTLQEAVALCKELDLVVIVDVKSNRWRSARLIHEMSRDDPNLCEHLAVISFYPGLLYLMAKMNPDIVCALARRDWEFTTKVDGSRRHDRWWRQLLAPFFDFYVSFMNHHVIWRLFQLPFVGLFKKEFTDEKLEYWRRRGAQVIVWTMGEEEARDFQQDIKVPVMVDILPVEN